jgi:undecaprenyl pyrophosphate phosphatase UppP
VLVTVLDIIVRRLPQGFTEHLPINAAAHFLLVPDQGLAVDAALHLGTVLAEGAGVQ